MLYNYRQLGIIADFALIINLILLIGILTILEATLTLPGIAGIILTVQPTGCRTPLATKMLCPCGSPY